MNNLEKWMLGLASVCILLFFLLMFLVGFVIYSKYDVKQSNISCTIHFCEGERVRVIASNKIGILYKLESNDRNEVWRIYIPEDGMYYVVPYQLLVSEDRK